MSTANTLSQGLQGLVSSFTGTATVNAPPPAVTAATPIVLTFSVDPDTDLQPVFITSPWGNWEVQPWNCASLAATKRLQAYLKSKLGLDSTISYDWPDGTFAGGSPFQQTGQVPFLDFPSATGQWGKHQAAGQIMLLYYKFPTAADDMVERSLSN